jgi:cobalt/nickel transport system permease protein
VSPLPSVAALAMAHIPDGFLSAPVVIGTATLSAAALTVAARRSRRRLAEREAPLLGALTAFVFAAQMLNFPLGAGTSAHLLGGVLVAALVGPWSGMLVMFGVILIQALLFQDGGIAALGANTLNMAVLGAGGGFVLYRWAVALLGDKGRRRVIAAGLAAFGSTVMVGVAVAVELAASHMVPLRPAVIVVGGAHVLVGLGEAVLTASILALVARSRPDLVTAGAAPSRATRRLAFVTLVVALAVAVTAAYVASSRPDMVAAAAERFGLTGRETRLVSAPLAGYTAPRGGPWVAAVVGVTVLFGLTWVVARAVARRRS